MNKSSLLAEIKEIETYTFLGNQEIVMSKLRALYYRIQNEGLDI